jgi:hypothetical protein
MTSIAVELSALTAAIAWRILPASLELSVRSVTVKVVVGTDGVT